MKEPKLMEWDVENFPNQTFTWGKYEQNTLHFTRPRMICSIAYRWVGEEEIHCKTLADFNFDPNNWDNRKLLLWFYKEYDKADMTIAHNGNGFDNKVVNTDFLKLGFKPPRPHMSIDTLRILRGRFKFNSNKLNDVCDELNIGKKLPHQGFKLWLDCMNNDPRAWEIMKAYNMHDIVLLRGLYNKIKAWDPTHPDLSNFRRDFNCPLCGSSARRFKMYKYNLASVKKQYQCLAKGCGKYYLGPTEASKKTISPALTKGSVRMG